MASTLITVVALAVTSARKLTVSALLPVNFPIDDVCAVVTSHELVLLLEVLHSADIASECIKAKLKINMRRLENKFKSNLFFKYLVIKLCGISLIDRSTYIILNRVMHHNRTFSRYFKVKHYESAK